jgi:hypothetical protein
MRKAFYILIPFLVAILIFAIIVLFLTRSKDKGALQVTSFPPSQVYLNGNLIGQTPVYKYELKDLIDVGNYTIKMVPTQGDFQPFEQKITISPKVLTVVDRTFGPQALSQGSIIDLTPIQNSKDAQISTISFPDVAEVFLDNNLVGQTPLLLKGITESDHELKLTKEGYKDKVVKIRTVLGYKLEALIFMGIDAQVATASANPSSPSAAIAIPKILILDTPTGFLRVRETASIGSAEVGQVKPGESYQLLDTQSGWYKIKLSNNKEGWISSQYAKK